MKQAGGRCCRWFCRVKRVSVCSRSTYRPQRSFTVVWGGSMKMSVVGPNCAERRHSFQVRQRSGVVGLYTLGAGTSMSTTVLFG